MSTSKNNNGHIAKRMVWRWLTPASFLLLAALLALVPGTAMAQVPTITAVCYYLADGTKLTGYLAIPQEYQQGKKYPAILLIHGWRGVNKRQLQGLAENYLREKIHQKYLCHQYVVFAAEYYADHLGDSREFESMSAALKTMATIPQIDQQRIAVIGASHGGYLALMSMMNPSIQPKPKVGVDICGVVDVASWVRYLKNKKNKTELLPGLQKFACTIIPQAYGWPPNRDAATKQDYARISVLTYVSRLQGPLLMIYNQRDKQVPISQAYMLREALQHENKNFEFLELNNDRDNHFIFLNNVYVWEKIQEFLDKYL